MALSLGVSIRRKERSLAAHPVEETACAEVQRKAGSEPWGTETWRDIEGHRENQKSEALRPKHRGSITPSSLHKSGRLRSSSIDWVVSVPVLVNLPPHRVGSSWQPCPARNFPPHSFQGSTREAEKPRHPLGDEDGGRGWPAWGRAEPGQGELSGFGSGVAFKLHDLGQASPHLYPSPLPDLSSSHIP